jgi:hypothetical protein
MQVFFSFIFFFISSFKRADMQHVHQYMPMLLYYKACQFTDATRYKNKNIKKKIKTLLCNMKILYESKVKNTLLSASDKYVAHRFNNRPFHRPTVSHPHTPGSCHYLNRSPISSAVSPFILPALIVLQYLNSESFRITNMERMTR